MRIPLALLRLTKEVARHVLRRPVVGICAAARTTDGRYLLVRRSDTGGWALPGGTLEWGETLATALTRELAEETGAKVLELGRLVGVFSDPGRDARFHAVTIVVEARVELLVAKAENPLEILEVRAFAESELPAELSYRMTDMLEAARSGRTVWE